MFVGLNLSALKIQVSETYGTPAFYFTVSDFHRVRPGLNKIFFYYDIATFSANVLI